MHKKRSFSVIPWRPNHVTISECDFANPMEYRMLKLTRSRCKMANSSSEDETDTLPERPTRIQPYQFEPVRQDFERVPELHVSFNTRYSMGFAKSHSLKCSLHKWAWCGAARKSARLNCINLIHFRLTACWLHGSLCIVIPGVVCELLQFAATQ